MQNNGKYLGLVTKKFNEYFLVDLNLDDWSINNNKFLCKVKKSVQFKNEHIYVGDQVIVDHLDLKTKRALIVGFEKRINLLTRPSVANISNIYVVFSVKEPNLDLSQVNRFLISAESIGVEVSLVLTKCDLISEEKKLYLIEKFKE